MKLTQKTMNNIKKESETAIKRMESGKTAIEIAGEIYCKSLPNKDYETGKVMARRIDSTILSYEQNVKSALEDADTWVSEHIEKQLDGKSLEERCRTLFSLLIGVSSLNDVLSGQKTIDEIEQEYSFDVQYVSEEYENSLKEQLIAAVKSSAYGEYQLKALDQALENGQSDVSIGDVISFGQKGHDVKVIMAMIAYVNVKNGSITEMPFDISLDEVAISVASSYDIAAAAEQVEEGEISKEEGFTIVEVISMVASIMIATILTAVSLLGIGILINLFLPKIIGIPLLIVAGIAIWGLFCEVARDFTEIVIKLGAKVFKGGFALLKKGVKKLMDFIKQTVIPKVTEGWAKIKAYLKKLREENTETEQQTEATVQA